MNINKNDRQKRIIARGEHSNHAHIVTGNATIETKNGDIFITAKDDTVIIRHLLEKQFLSGGQEIWTNEHTDINLEAGIYKYIPQTETNPLDGLIRQVAD